MAFSNSNKTLRTPPQLNIQTPRNETLKDQTYDESNDTPSNICPVCNLTHTGDGMVSCDGCRQWYHFKCVGETDEVINRDWYCSLCTAKRNREIKNVEFNKRNVPSKTSSKKSSKHSSSSKHARQLMLQKLDEEKMLKGKRANEERERQEQRDKEYLDKKYSILETETNGVKTSDVNSVENWLNKLELGRKSHHPTENTFVKHPNLAHSSFMPPANAPRSIQSNLVDNQLGKPAEKYTGTKPKGSNHVILAVSQSAISSSNIPLPIISNNNVVSMSNCEYNLHEPVKNNKPNVRHEL